jgi:hypothetical protein
VLGVGAHYRVRPEVTPHGGEETVGVEERERIGGREAAGGFLIKKI